MELDSYTVITALVVSAIVIFAYPSVAEAYGNEKVFYKLAVARDITLAIDEMYAAPGDFEFVYPNDVSDYDIEVKGCVVKVYEHNSEGLDPTIGVHKFACVEGDKINALVKNKKFARIKKIDSRIKIDGVNELPV